MKIVTQGATALHASDDWHFVSVSEAHRFLAYQLLAPMLVGHLHEVLKLIARHVHTRLMDLIALVTPTWVDGEAARQLLNNGDHRVVAVLNAQRPEVATHYVLRAACCSLSYRIQTVSLIAGEEQRVEFSNACERQE